MIERAVIISRGGALDFDLPAADSTPRPAGFTSGPGAPGCPELFTEAEMRRRERGNLAAVLEKTGWKIKGPGGAAEFLGLKHTTLFARLKKMGLKKPASP